MDSSHRVEVRRPRPEELEAYYRLRWSTLRAPKGLPPGSERDTLDGTDEVWDLAAFVRPASYYTEKAPPKAPSSSSLSSTNDREAFSTEDGQMMVGVGRVQMMGPPESRPAEPAPPGSVAATNFGTQRVARVRLMGVHPDWRRKGVGRALIEGVMEAAREWRCLRVTADARIEALDYYLACGFKAVSDEYYIKNIGPHYRVEKRV